MEGTVKFFDPRKGFGFIKSDEDDEEYFVHKSELEVRDLDDDARVSFDPEEGDRGLKATNVEVLE